VGRNLVARKDPHSLAALDGGLDELHLMDNLDSLRGWGHPRDLWRLTVADVAAGGATGEFP